jgi:DNA mismatch repair protein MSH6
MPPKTPNPTAPKQKSLMNYFGKAPVKPTPKPTPKASASNASKVPQTPESKGPDVAALNSSVAASTSSYGGSSPKETPPTSDVIDVDMFSSEEDDTRVRVKTVRLRLGDARRDV